MGTQRVARKIAPVHRVLFCALLALLTTVASACATAPTNPRVASTPMSGGGTEAVAKAPASPWPQSVTGEWEGTSNSAGGFTNKVVLRLTQNGTEVRGTYDFESRTRRSDWDEEIVGTLINGRPSLQRPRRAFDGFDAIVNGENMEGILLRDGIFGRFAAVKIKRK